MIDLTEPFGLTYPCVLMPLPCGCVINSSLRVIEGIILCPWCEATFFAVDFGEWINSDAPPPICMENGPRSMIICREGHLHEVHGEHGGLPVIRMGDDLVSVDHFVWVSN